MKNTRWYKIINRILKIISWCIMGILCVIGVFLITYIAINKIAQSKGNSAPLGLYTIISPSMTPDIDVYDVVFVVKKDPEEIKVGDIISFYSTNSYFGKTPITHRVVEKYNTNTGITFRTKGDANNKVDDEIVLETNVIGTVRFVIPQLGRIQFFLASKGGWFIVILIPALGIIIYDIIKLVKLLALKNKMDYIDEANKIDQENIKKSDNFIVEEPFIKEEKNYNYINNEIEESKIETYEISELNETSKNENAIHRENEIIEQTPKYEENYTTNQDYKNYSEEQITPIYRDTIEKKQEEQEYWRVTPDENYTNYRQESINNYQKETPEEIINQEYPDLRNWNNENKN